MKDLGGPRSELLGGPNPFDIGSEELMTIA
jgi:hypothetical protein